MRLKEVEHNKTWFFHLIDSVTRYPQACEVHKKHQNGKFIGYGFLILGVQRSFLSDNSGEFANKSFIDKCTKLNVEAATTAGNHLSVMEQ